MQQPANEWIFIKFDTVQL